MVRVNTPSSEVSRAANITVFADDMVEFLKSVHLDDPPTPVRILFDNDGISVWTTNQTRTLQVFADRWDMENYTIESPCVILVNPKELSDMLQTKSRGEVISIRADAHSAVEITNSGGGGFSIMPADEDECLTIPDRWVLPVKDGERIFPMFRNEKADWMIDIDIVMMRDILKDMTVAKAPYVELTLTEDGGKAESGHWTSKTTRSWTGVDFVWVKPHTADCTIRFTDNLKQILSTFHKDTTSVRISKHRDGAFVLIEANNGTKTVFVLATEAVKES